MKTNILAPLGVIAITLTGLVTGCGSSGQTTTSQPPTSMSGGKPNLSYKGTITMYAQAYTPYIKGVYLSAGSPKLKGFKEAAQAFEKLYPGITIKFVNSNTYGSTQWYETEASGGLLPDVTWVPYGTVDSALPKGVFTNLAPYFAKPDPFISGNKKWSDIMNPSVLQMTKAPNGDQYVLDADWVATAFYYNKNLFKQADITSVPKTWAQLVADSKKLKAHGIDPGAMTSSYLYSWWNRIFNANAIGKSQLDKLLAADHGVGVVDSTAQVKGYESGVLNPAKNPALTAWWPAVHELMSLWDKSVLEVPTNNSNPGAPSADNYFGAGKVAMVYDGSWVPPTLKNMPNAKKFPMGSFTIDNLTGTSKYASSLVTSQDVGGPSAAWSYGVASQKSDHSMTPDKLKAVMAWMQFIGTPKWDGKIVDELGSFVPTFKGAKATPANAGIVKSLSLPFYQLDLFENLTSQAGTQTANLFQEYVDGGISFQAAQQQYNQIAAQAVQQYKTKNNVQ